MQKELKMRYNSKDENFTYWSIYDRENNLQSREIKLEQIEDNMYITKIAFKHNTELNENNLIMLEDYFAIMQTLKEICKNEVNIQTYAENNGDIFMQVCIERDVVDDVFMQM
jgi:hypothetical protein